jgi:aspergillopepsin I
VNDNVVSDYYSQIENAEYNYTHDEYTFACNTTLSDITFFINDYDIVISEKLMNFAATDNERTTCFDELQSNDDLSENIFEDSLLKSQFIVFDINNSRIGFALQT